MEQDEYGPLPRGINHIGLTVPDLDQASRFLAKGFGAKWCYDGLTTDNAPREGAQVEHQLGLPKGARITRQRLMRIGNGPNIEIFQVEAPNPDTPLGLADRGWNHISIYCDDIESALARAIAAGATPLSDIHGNSRHEDTPGNGSVYVRPPWGGLIELQTIPGGNYYPEDSQAKAWLPDEREN
ncbi:MAG: VOC family protein [Paracoccus denitrificans]|uniref:VOC family protein n=1 Tax=Paracoccus denitrificans TaxID=266 RepID=A0A533I8I9_PARDE|nr:MAG: VOC family protein [Paracoccus denitrificans]